MKLSNTLYNILKWSCLMGIPAISWLYVTLAPEWGLPNPDRISKTLDAVTFVLSMWLGLSGTQYWNNHEIVPKGAEDENGE